MNLAPRTLQARLTVILCGGIVVAYALSMWTTLQEATSRVNAMMLDYASRDIDSSLALLDRLAPDERRLWLNKLDRPNYTFQLESPPEGIQPTTHPWPLASALADRLGPQRVMSRVIGEHQAALVLRLSDASRLTLRLIDRRHDLDAPALARLILQIAVVSGCVAWCVRLASRPLARLAAAAHRLGHNLAAPPLEESGPDEVRRAAVAFNTMQRELIAFTQDRLHVLAAVTHDLRTPLTRMSVRCEMLGDAAARDRLAADIAQMRQLIDEGLTWARLERTPKEASRRLDLVALVDGIVCEFQETGSRVAWGQVLDPGMVIDTQPLALRRAVVNLIDNAIKHAGAAEVSVTLSKQHVTVLIEDRGPGMTTHGLVTVPGTGRDDPVEVANSPSARGTGLGLPIVSRLCALLEAQLMIGPRPGGGLSAAIQLRRDDV